MEMGNAMTLYFKRAVQMLLSENEFREIKNELSSIPVAQRIAFWNLIQAGFSTGIAFKNCKIVFELKEMYDIKYDELLQMTMLIDTEHNKGIYSKEIEMYELN